MSMTAYSVPARARPQPDRRRKGRLPQNARIVLHVLLEAARPIKAYGLLEKLQDKGITAPMTVYRALDRLISEGLVRKVESLNAFVALPEPARGPVALVICRKCGRARAEPLDASGCAWLEAAGVDARETYIEAYGDCHGCEDT